MSEQKKFHSGFVAILGRPNVGKSTLMNAMIGEKVAIISPKAQTTRNRIMGVLTGEGWQAIFLDTPGIHKPRTALGDTMMKAVDGALEDTEMILFVVDAADFREKDIEILQKYAQVNCKKILALNKIDLVEKPSLLALMEKVSPYVTDIMPVSALSGNGVDKLRDLIAQNLPEGPQYFPDDYLTDQQERFLVAEAIREKALLNLDQEIPHGIGVEIMGIKTAPSGVVHIDATIYCERDAHKNIIIGKHGSMIGRIGSQARPDIERLLDKHVNLKLWVKVVPDWRNRQSELKTLGYLEN